MNRERIRFFSLAVLFISVAGILQAKPATIFQSNRESKTYEIGDFSELLLEGAFKVYLIQGEETSLRVEASDPAAFDYLNVTNRNDYLHLHVDREPFDFSRVSLFITFKTLERLEIEGGIKLKTRGYLNLNDLYVSLEGGAKIELQAKARDITIESEGGVMFELDGIARSLDVKVSGAGHIDAGELECKEVSFKIEGVGTGRVFATEKLYAQINGVGKIRYLGNPEVTENIDGLGSVDRE
jgi:hypothetical protein